MFKRINNSFKEKINKSLLIISFVLLLLIFVWIIIFKGVGLKLSFNSIKGIRGQILVNINKDLYTRFMFQFEYVFHFSSFIRDIIPNIILFIPFGFLLSILNKNKFGINLLITFCISLFFELFELITGIGGISYIDLITNIVGFILGYGIYKILILLCKNDKKINTILNYILVTFIILAIPLTIYGFIETIINFDIFLPCFRKDNYINLFNFK